MREWPTWALEIAASAALLVAGGCSSRGSDAQPRIAESGRWFVAKGCAGCHTIDSLGVVGPTRVAPDLSLAAEDVPRRYGMSLDQFLSAPPSGMMSIVLSSRIQLTPDDRASAVSRLEEALQRARKHGDAPGTPRAPAAR